MLKLKDFKRTQMGVSGILLSASLMMPSLASADKLNDDINLKFETHLNDSLDRLKQRISAYKDSGMIPIDIDFHLEGGEYVYTTVWREKGSASIEDWLVTQTESYDEFYDGTYQLRLSQGYRLIDVEYTLNEQDKAVFSSIWVKDTISIPWEAKFAISEDEFQEFVDERAEKGRRLLDVERVSYGPDLNFYSVIDVKNVEGRSSTFHQGLTQNELDTASFDVDALDIDAYWDGSGVKFNLLTMVREERTFNSNFEALTSRSMNESQFKHGEFDRIVEGGTRVTDIERYETPAGARYLYRFHFKRKDALSESTQLVHDKIDAAIKGHQNANSSGAFIPGISVAIIKDDEFFYKQGFGYADVENRIPATSKTVYLSASLSKLIGGTLTVKMQEEGLLDVNDATRLHVPDMPEHHTHTIAQLLAHVGCVKHYGELSGAINHTTHYPSAEKAAEFFWKEKLLTYDVVPTDVDPRGYVTPGDTECKPGSVYINHYSTPSYTLVAAALESAGNSDITTLLDSRILNQFDSMRVQFATPSLPDIDPLFRATPYVDNDTPTQYENNNWKILGGGIESNVADMAQFGLKVLNNEIISKSSRDNYLWSKGNRGGGYGLGWRLAGGEDNFHARWDGHWAKGARSALRVYRDKGLVIAIMSNRGQNNIRELEQRISDIMLDL